MGVRRAKDLEKTEEDKEEKTKKKRLEKKKKMIEGIRGLVRIGEVDVEGDKKIINALLKVRGVGKSLSKAFSVAADLDPNILIGSLNDDQIKKLEDVMKNPGNYGIPSHMFNRKKDPQTGEEKHLIASELRFAVKSDIDLMRKIRCYKGIRHESGLPVRGQRTRSSFRKGAIVGVIKKKAERSKARKEIKEIQ